MEVWEEKFFLSNLRRCIPCQEYPEGGDGRPEISLAMETEPSLSEKRKRFKKQHYLTTKSPGKSGSENEWVWLAW